MKKVAIFTGNRAEYGLLAPVIKSISNHPSLKSYLLVSGAHLDVNFGKTLDEIKRDGFKDFYEIKINMSADTLLTAKAIGSGILSISDKIMEIKPDVFVVYADRFEGFAAMIASTQMNIPTVHIEGGDITEGGALDDSVRHSMTKLAHIHLTTNDEASQRIMNMGEESWRVHTVGFPLIDFIKEKNYESKNNLVQKFNLDLEKPLIVFTQHSVTTEFKEAKKQILPSLAALKKAIKNDIQVIITFPNNDAGGIAIINQIQKFSSIKSKNLKIIQSLGRFNYHGLLALSLEKNSRVICMGNSSSGIKETPAFGCPTINIGSRQKSRLRGENILDFDYYKNKIYDAILMCINDKNFINKCKNTFNPYGLGDVGKKVADIILNLKIDKDLLRKRMTI